MWPVYVFNLVAALLIAGWYLRAVRRLERRMDERMRKFDAWADAEDAKYDIARDEIRASMRAQVDRAIAEMQAETDRINAELAAMVTRPYEPATAGDEDPAYPPHSPAVSD